ncbi:MAG: phosphate ABC transporter substrate-binding protein [Oscillospiraceae bacterium]|jgi:phosphate transport system substrate-binding protein|nr:phosphate ABC transporter substrate-binding protein [Oscillospiraceae bacterium]
MKKISGLIMAIILTAAVFAGCNDADTASTASGGTASVALSGVVKTGGSTSVEKVMNALIYQFQADNDKVTIDYEANGSGDGIKGTMNVTYELGHSSRELKTDGTEDGLTAVAYAIDGIAIVVHKDNATANLTKAQIKGIYTGKITNWKEVGGKDAPITVVTREVGSGTRSGIADIIGLEKKDSTGNADPETAIIANATVADSTGAVQTTVSANANAIGYMSFSDVDTSKVSTVKYEGVAISESTIKDKTYALQREFFLLYKTGATLSAPAEAFKNFALSAEGQIIVKNQKLLSVNGG